MGTMFHEVLFTLVGIASLVLIAYAINKTTEDMHI
jgi:uncharacterized membrane protein YuzA (DUF378 family)